MSTPAATPAPASTPASAAPSTPAATPAPASAAPQGLSPERLDQVISTTKPRGWIALIAVIVIVILTLIWSIVAVIPQQTSGVGVVSALAYSEDITSTADGIFNAVKFSPGEGIKKGDTIGIITPYDGRAAIEVKASTSGALSQISVDNGAGVHAGDTLAVIQIPPDISKGIVVVTYLSESDAITYTPGEVTSVSITNLAQSVTTDAQATVVSVSSSPSSEESMTIQAGSAGTVEEWQKKSGGSAYRVVLSISSSADIPANLVPQAGQTVQIVNEFGSIHPIELLFGAK